MARYNKLNIEEDHALHLAANLNLQRKLGKYCDVCICVEEKRFLAHQSILSANSPKLDFLIMEAVGGDGNHDVEVEVEGISSVGFEALLEYFYTGKLLLQSDTVVPICKASAYLEMTNVVKKCNEFCKSIADVPPPTVTSHYRNELKDVSHPQELVAKGAVLKRISESRIKSANASLVEDAPEKSVADCEAENLPQIEDITSTTGPSIVEVHFGDSDSECNAKIDDGLDGMLLEVVRLRQQHEELQKIRLAKEAQVGIKLGLGLTPKKLRRRDETLSADNVSNSDDIAQQEAATYDDAQDATGDGMSRRTSNQRKRKEQDV